MIRHYLQRLTYPYVSGKTFSFFMLFFRVLVSLELILVHGLKKIGIGGAAVEVVPNPLHLPEIFNQSFAIAANLFFPVLVILGCVTRLSVIPILCVTLTGYFVVHWHDSGVVKDVPFMYSMCYSMILFFGAGNYSLDHVIYKLNQQ